MILAILSAVAYVAIAPFAFREIIRCMCNSLYAYELPSTGEIVLAIFGSLVWPIGVFFVWIIFGGPSWWRTRGLLDSLARWALRGYKRKE